MYIFKNIYYTILLFTFLPLFLNKFQILCTPHIMLVWCYAQDYLIINFSLFVVVF